MIADNAGYIMWEDSELVMFYSNNLKTTPLANIMDENDEKAIEAVHGLVNITCWTGSEVMH